MPRLRRQPKQEENETVEETPAAEVTTNPVVPRENAVNPTSPIYTNNE